MMPLEDLFKVDYKSREYNEADRMRTFYAESWAVVHYLLGDPKYRVQVGHFLDSLQRGEPPDHAFAISFDADYEPLKAQVSNYISNGRFRFGIVDRSQIRDANTSARVERMARDEVLARLGDLLLRSGTERSKEAEPYFREALRINPKCAAAEAGLGFLAALQERFPESIVHYDSAIALDSGEFDYPYLAALSWLGESPHARESASRSRSMSPANLAKARELLRKTIQLRPGFAEAYVSLGKTYLIEDEKGKEGIAFLLKAQKLLPRRMDVATSLVQLYLKVEDRTSAGEVVEKVLVPWGDSELIRVARAALEDYDRTHGSTNLGA